MARLAWLAAVAVAFAATACSGAHPAHSASPAPRPGSPSVSSPATGAPAPQPPPVPANLGSPPVPGAAYAAGGCGPRPLLTGTAPRWAASANPPVLRYALGQHQQVAGFLFGYPLQAGAHPLVLSDKILWVVRSPRLGSPLRLAGHPLNAPAPVVRSSWSAGSSPGEIYPSQIEVPTPGCWQFTLSWHGHTDTVDLWYVRHR
jgi:hypothetical protein